MLTGVARVPFLSIGIRRLACQNSAENACVAGLRELLNSPRGR